MQFVFNYIQINTLSNRHFFFLIVNFLEVNIFILIYILFFHTLVTRTFWDMEKANQVSVND